MVAHVPPPDRWSRWFFRLVQGTGLALGVHEGLGAGRPFVMLFAGALILGAVGVRILIRGVSELSEAANREVDREQRG